MEAGSSTTIRTIHHVNQAFPTATEGARGIVSKTRTPQVIYRRPCKSVGSQGLSEGTPRAHAAEARQSPRDHPPLARAAYEDRAPRKTNPTSITATIGVNERNFRKSQPCFDTSQHLVVTRSTALFQSQVSWLRTTSLRWHVARDSRRNITTHLRIPNPTLARLARPRLKGC